MNLVHVRDLFRLWACTSGATTSLHQLYTLAELTSAERLATGVQLTMQLPRYALSSYHEDRVYSATLHTLLDAATSVSAWLSHPDNSYP